MIQPIIIYVPAVPVAQPRPRATIRGGHAGIHEVTSIKNSDGERRPHPIAAFKATVRLAAVGMYDGAPMVGPIRCDLCFVFPRPRNLIWKKRPMPRIRHIGRPDRDNLDKAVMDALKQIVWVDDSQVCDGRIEKWIAAGDEQPHVVITIQELEDESLTVPGSTQIAQPLFANQT